MVARSGRLLLADRARGGRGQARTPVDFRTNHGCADARVWRTAAAGINAGVEPKDAVMRETAKSSDQLPEEGPAQLVPDDVPGAPEGAARTAGRRNARRANA